MIGRDVLAPLAPLRGENASAKLWLPGEEQRR
jgi:hypothetical protein